jgi:GNAT superfamily N-acetyltransferase
VPLVVRDADVRDASALYELWRLLPDLPLGTGVETDDGESAVAAAIARLATDPQHRVVVAALDGRVIGSAFLRIGVATPLEPERAVFVTHLHVDAEYARHGAGRGLLEAGVAWAEDHGIERFLVATLADDRDANRFLARLGLAQVAVLRGSSVPALRALLPLDASPVARNGRRMSRQVGQIVAARRSQRRARGRGAAVGGAD